jgi:type IV secretory pathway component VirB8
MDKKNKKYIEPEIINESFKKAEEFGKDKIDMMEGQIKSIKNAILLKGITSLIVPILIFLLIIGGIS